MYLYVLVSLTGFLSRIFSLLTNDTAEVVYLVLNTITEKVCVPDAVHSKLL